MDKGGRPKKMLSEKRKYQVNIKLKTEEYYGLKSQADRASMPKTDYVRQCIAKSVVVQRMNPEVINYVRALCGMANNLNQIAKKTHQTGYSNTRTEYLHLAESIDNLINKIRDST